MAPSCRRRGGLARPGRGANNDLIARCVALYPEIFAGVCMLPQIPKADLDRLDRGAGALRHRARLHRLQPQSRSRRRPFHQPAADRPLLVSLLREDGRARRAGDDPRLGQLQSGPARHRRLLHRRRHDRLHAADRGRSVRAISRRCASSSRMAAARCPIIGAAIAGSPTCSSSRRSTAHVMNNVYFDTCVYHQPGIDLLAEVIDTKNILFGSEMVGAVRGIDPADRPLFRRHQALCRRAADQRRRRSTRSSRAMPAASSRGSTRKLKERGL